MSLVEFWQVLSKRKNIIMPPKNDFFYIFGTLPYNISPTHFYSAHIIVNMMFSMLLFLSTLTQVLA